MRKLLAILAVTAFFMLPVFVGAQPFPDETPPCDGPFGSPCPIDGGVSILIAAGLAFGGKKAFDISRKK